MLSTLVFDINHCVGVIRHVKCLSCFAFTTYMGLTQQHLHGHILAFWSTDKLRLPEASPQHTTSIYDVQHWAYAANMA